LFSSSSFPYHSGIFHFPGRVQLTTSARGGVSQKSVNGHKKSLSPCGERLESTFCLLFSSCRPFSISPDQIKRLNYFFHIQRRLFDVKVKKLKMLSFENHQ